MLKTIQNVSLSKLEEVINKKFKSKDEAIAFFKSIYLTAEELYNKKNRSKDEQIILSDSMAALWYVTEA